MCEMCDKSHSNTIGLGVFGYLGALVEKIATRENVPDVVWGVDLVPSVDFTETETGLFSARDELG